MLKPKVFLLTVVCLLGLWCPLAHCAPWGEEFSPDGNAAAPVVLLVSGAAGPGLYREFARDLVKLGYGVVLVNGNNYWSGSKEFENALSAIAKAGKSKDGKVAVIGLSRGGGAALRFAAPLQQQVALVVAYYPEISGGSVKEFGRGVAVPTLILAGEVDFHAGCCRIADIRDFKAAIDPAKAYADLVVYPQAGHGFNLRGASTFRAQDSDDAFARVRQVLQRFYPLQ